MTQHWGPNRYDLPPARLTWRQHLIGLGMLLAVGIIIVGSAAIHGVRLWP